MNMPQVLFLNFREKEIAHNCPIGTLQTYEMKGNGCFKAAAISIKTGCKELYLTDIDKIRCKPRVIGFFSFYEC